MQIFNSYCRLCHITFCKINPSLIQLIYEILANCNFRAYFKPYLKSVGLIVSSIVLGKKLQTTYHSDLKVKVTRWQKVKGLIFSFFVSTKFWVVITFSLIKLIKKCNNFLIRFPLKTRFYYFDNLVRAWNSISERIKNVKFGYFLVPLLIVPMAESI